jgi:hypothetical protein
LQAERKQVQGSLDLANATKDALQKIGGMAGVDGRSARSRDVNGAGGGGLDHAGCKAKKICLALTEGEMVGNTPRSGGGMQPL